MRHPLGSSSRRWSWTLRKGCRMATPVATPLADGQTALGGEAAARGGVVAIGLHHLERKQALDHRPHERFVRRGGPASAARQGTSGCTGSCRRHTSRGPRRLPRAAPGLANHPSASARLHPASTRPCRCTPRPFSGFRCTAGWPQAAHRRGEVAVRPERRQLREYTTLRLDRDANHRLAWHHVWPHHARGDERPTHPDGNGSPHA